MWTQGFQWLGLNWNSVFIVFCWWIWKYQNKVTFQKGYLQLSIIILKKQVQEIVNVYQKREREKVGKQEIFIRWITRPMEWLMLNTDRASQAGAEVACGGLIKNAYGHWICGFSRNLGHANSMEVELWGLFHGLSMA